MRVLTIANAITLAGWLAVPVCSGLVVALRDQRRRTREAQAQLAREEDEHRRLVDKGMKVLLRRELVDAYRDHVSDGMPLTVERMHEITEVHAAYNGFGGNGTGDAMYDAICAKQIHIVK